MDRLSHMKTCCFNGQAWEAAPWLRLSLRSRAFPPARSGGFLKYRCPKPLDLLYPILDDFGISPDIGNLYLCLVIHKWWCGRVIQYDGLVSVRLRSVQMSQQCKHQSYWYCLVRKQACSGATSLVLVFPIYRYVPFEHRLFGNHWSERTHGFAKSWTQVIAKHGEPLLPELAPLLQGDPQWERDEPFRSRRQKNFVSMWRQAIRII